MTFNNRHTIRRNMLSRMRNFTEYKKIPFPISKKYTDVDLLMANIIQQSYQPITKRKNVVNYQDLYLLQQKDKSNDLWAHYEDGGNILVGIHGVNSVESAIIGSKKFINDKAEEDIFKKLDKKYKELLKSNKNVIIAGHSLGGFSINKSYEKQDVKLKAIVFASYQPNNNKNWASRYNIRKHLYLNDFIASNVMNDADPIDLHIYVPTTLKLKLNGHTINNFLDKKQLNNSILVK